MLHGGEIYDKKIEYDFSVNLNPLPCPEEVKKALKAAITDIDKYPDMSQKSFRESVAKAENHYLKNVMGSDVSITPQMILGGNGASELIFAIVRMLNPKKVLIPVPSFYGYRHALLALDDERSISQNCSENKKDVDVQKYFLNDKNDFELTLDFADEIRQDTDLIILANPNNPTGKIIPEDVLEEIIIKCRETETALIVDECFLHLSEAKVSVLKYIHDLDKLFVVSAYTKLFSIPGVRLGFAISDEKNIGQLKKYLPEWNMSAFAEYAGIACSSVLLNSDFESESKNLIKDQKDQLRKALLKKDIRVFSSDANYILIYTEKNIYEKFLDKGILIRDCSNFEGLPKGYYRIAVKDKKSNERLLDAINTVF